MDWMRLIGIRGSDETRLDEVDKIILRMQEICDTNGNGYTDEELKRKGLKKSLIRKD